MPKLAITQRLLQRSAEHIAYEILMLRYAAQKLASLDPSAGDQLEINAGLECFAVHARNLFFFFYTEVGKRIKDDIVASDYVSSKSYFKQNRAPKRELKNVTTKTSKQIAHLTFRRVKFNSRTKGWQFGQVYLHLDKTVEAFLSSLDTEKRAWFQNWGI